MVEDLSDYVGTDVFLLHTLFLVSIDHVSDLDVSIGALWSDTRLLIETLFQVLVVELLAFGTLWALGRARCTCQPGEPIGQTFAIQDWHLDFLNLGGGPRRLHKIAIPQRHILQILNDRLVLFERVTKLVNCLMAGKGVPSEVELPTIDTYRYGVLI